jgi:hypothetical protein
MLDQINSEIRDISLALNEIAVKLESKGNVYIPRLNPNQPIGDNEIERLNAIRTKLGAQNAVLSKINEALDELTLIP